MYGIHSTQRHVFYILYSHPHWTRSQQFQRIRNFSWIFMLLFSFIFRFWPSSKRSVVIEANDQPNKRRWRTNRTKEEKNTLRTESHIHMCVITVRQHWDLCSIIPLFVSFIFCPLYIRCRFSSFDYIFRVLLLSTIRLWSLSSFSVGIKGKIGNCLISAEEKKMFMRPIVVHSLCVSYVKTEITRLQQLPLLRFLNFIKIISYILVQLACVMATIWLLTKRRTVDMKLNKIIWEKLKKNNAA